MVAYAPVLKHQLHALRIWHITTSEVCQFLAMFCWVESVKRGHTCQQHRPMHLESKGQKRSKAHCVCRGDKDLGVRHGRVVLECRHCFFPRSQGIVSAAGRKERWHNYLQLCCSNIV